MLDFNFIVRNLPLFVDGIVTTVVLSTAGGVGALCGGAIVVAGTTSHVPAVRAVAQAYVEVMRNTPVLIQMFLIFFGLAAFGIRLSAFTSALLALTMQNSAYVGEIYRAGFRSVSSRQYEAALALGLLPRTAIVTMIMPQALRRIIPPLASQLVIILKIDPDSPAINNDTKRHSQKKPPIHKNTEAEQHEGHSPKDFPDSEG